MTKIYNSLAPKDILIFVFLIALAITGYFNLKTNSQIMEHDAIRMKYAKTILNSTESSVEKLNSLLSMDSTRTIRATVHRRTTDSLIQESMKQNVEIIKNQKKMLDILTK